jgi:hypothetical protein
MHNFLFDRPRSIAVDFNSIFYRDRHILVPWHLPVCAFLLVEENATNGESILAKDWLYERHQGWRLGKLSHLCEREQIATPTTSRSTTGIAFKRLNIFGDRIFIEHALNEGEPTGA